MEKQRWEVGRVREERRREEKKREDQRRERVRRKKMQVREKVEKSRFTAFFQCSVALEGRKVGSLKWRVRSHVARWQMKNCTLVWCQTHFQVKMAKAPQRRSTFGSLDVEKVHTGVARSTCPSQNAQSTPFSDHFWKLRCWKSARRCGTKHISKSKGTKHTMLGPLLELEMSKKCMPLWREAHFQVKMCKTPHVRTTFGRSDVVLRGRRKGLCTLSKVSKTWGFCSSFKTVGRRATFEEDLERCISRGRRSTRDMFIRDVRRSGCWSPERGCILEHPIFNCSYNYNRNCNYTLVTHYNHNSTTPHYNYDYYCAKPHYIRWPLQPLQPLQKTQLQPPFGPSVDSLCHPWFATTNLSYRLLFLKLPPPPCAALLVSDILSSWCPGISMVHPKLSQAAKQSLEIDSRARWRWLGMRNGSLARWTSTRSWSMWRSKSCGLHQELENM